jgi:hypothetical protein
MLFENIFFEFPKKSNCNTLAKIKPKTTKNE